jgi:hypothetical protein
MVTTLDASTLFLEDVNRLLKFKHTSNISIAPFLNLEPLTEFEREEFLRICNLFESYYSGAKISEGAIKFLFLAPLLNLAGFYTPSIKISLEERIAEISVTDEDDEEIIVKGRMDILAVNKTVAKTTKTPFWILVIETKNSKFDAMEGLPQLLTYASTSLEHQDSVWGLTTNGFRYQFVYLEKGKPPSYQLFPDLNLMYPDRALELLQILKAICQL